LGNYNQLVPRPNEDCNIIAQTTLSQREESVSKPGRFRRKWAILMVLLGFVVGWRMLTSGQVQTLWLL
jgi:hypothetical protein